MQPQTRDTSRLRLHTPTQAADRTASDQISSLRMAISRPRCPNPDQVASDRGFKLSLDRLTMDTRAQKGQPQRLDIQTQTRRPNSLRQTCQPRPGIQDQTAPPEPQAGHSSSDRKTSDKTSKLRLHSSRPNIPAQIGKHHLLTPGAD